MQLRYDIPQHLEGVLGEMQTSDITQLITVMLEFAVSHKMLKYPEMQIERNVRDIVETVRSLDRRQDNLERMFTEQLRLINNKIDQLKVVSAERGFIPYRQVVDQEAVEDDYLAGLVKEKPKEVEVSDEDLLNEILA